MNGWVVIAQGDNDTELRTLRFPTTGMQNGVSFLVELVQVLERFPHREAEYTQLTLRAWHVEVQLAAPMGIWSSRGQASFARELSRMKAEMGSGPAA